MPYGLPLGVTAPTVSVTPGPTYATDVNLYLAALRAVVEAKVTPGGMDISSDLSFLSGADNWSAVDLLTTSHAIQDAALSAVDFPAAFYAAGVNGDAYFNDAAGNAIRLTSGGTLNTSLVGGITGSGYGTGGVEINWSSGNQAYRFFSGASTYADVVCDDLKLNDGDTNFVSIVSPAISADYTITLPTAVPGSANTLVTMSTGGVLSNTGTPTVTSVTTTGAVSVGTTLAVTSTSAFTGKITASGDVALPGRFRHVSAFDIRDEANGIGPTGTADNPHFDVSANGKKYYVPVPLLEGDRLTSIFVYAVTSATVYTRTAELRYYNTTVGAWTAAGGSGTFTWAASASNPQSSSPTVDIGSPSSTGTNVGFLGLILTLGQNDALWGVRFGYSRP
jgi:hypothetical protein